MSDEKPVMLGARARVSSNAEGYGLGIVRVLAARSSNSSRDSSEKAAHAFSPEEGLRPGEVLDKEGIAGRPIYIIRNALGHPVGVRKIATSIDPLPGHFTATLKEAVTYNELAKVHGWQNHVLPFRGERTTNDVVMIDFDWLDGEDVESYLKKYPDDFMPIFQKIIKQLHWLAMQAYTHGDIKLDNFYRAADGSILLFDFGRAAKVTFFTIMSDLMAVGRMLKPYNPELATWIQVSAVDEFQHAMPFYERLAAVYESILEKLQGAKKNSTSTAGGAGKKKSSSNSAKGAGARKTRKSSSSNR